MFPQEIRLKDARILRMDDIRKKIQVSGGSINETEIWIFGEKNEPVFVKINKTAPPDFFQREADGLEYIKNVDGAPIVPNVLFVSQHILILEYLNLLQRPQKDDIDFANRLLRLHRNTKEHFGLAYDNYIGKSRQKNGLYSNGATFYRDCRIAYLGKSLLEKGLLPLEMARIIDAICDNMERFCPEEPPVIVHGDLWHGNWSHIQLEHGHFAGVVFDPAMYWGFRESDLAMLRLFGKPSDVFWDAYTHQYPLQDGYEERELIFQLYHILNHVLMFGTTYHRTLYDHLVLIQNIL